MCPKPDQEQGPSGIDSGEPATPYSLELFFFPDCPFCRKVLGTLDDLGMKEKVVFHDTRSDPKAKEALIALTGKTQVPCLVVNGRPMHESEDIKQYLYQTFGG